MVLEYFHLKKGAKEKETEKSEGVKSPVLSAKDEEFLNRIASADDENPPPLPARPTVILDNGKQIEPDDEVQLVAEKVPLPMSPPEEKDIRKAELTTTPAKRSYLAFLPAVAMPKFLSQKEKARTQTANDLASAASALKTGINLPVDVDAATAEQEKADLSSLLDRLNLSAINNRVFSISQDSQKLMDDFTQVLKDIVNGVPTAYDDLERLLTRNHKQIKKMYKDLPPWLQTLVKSLPRKMGASLGPELMAMGSGVAGVKAAEAEKVDKRKEEEGEEKKKKQKKEGTVPSVKRLVSEQGAIATMLRSILNFLKLRFPALVTGTNVLMSLTVFLLLFVLWYCHKRGREVRLDQARLSAEADPTDYSDSDLERSVSDMDTSSMIASDVKEGIAPTEVDPPVIDDKPAKAPAHLEAALNQKDPAEVPLPKEEEETRQEKEPGLGK
ncbi:hypothetical protein P152DRAFT_457981 [Eremomyces bilateralis CBS 781.70]|uniref:Uncharacterized protein n=1 Tax=Eremomyces bilateralis CBS 781.70 TaxID=1392243 RepID=A0A6G1G434_9PEZI|nr:uncharacterized protein P152DRAFT_457981 [Eremomyces bilateralis CBS 781.70]KAF1812778.1 hypothetical protein P152DRAFT_457981 [Eremomyces bilateralis CBS 781.70]